MTRSTQDKGMQMKASEAVNRARGEINVREAPPGSNRSKYGAWYGMQGQPWCAIFVSWLFRGDLALIGGKHAYTPTFAAWFRGADQWGIQPRIGAIAFFDFPDNVNRIQHVGIVESIGNGTVTTIEGNTSSGTSGSQSNGGGVYRRVRPRSLIVGFGYPRYEKESAGTVRCNQTHGMHLLPSWVSPTIGKFTTGKRYRVTKGAVGKWRKLLDDGGKQRWGYGPYFD